MRSAQLLCVLLLGSLCLCTGALRAEPGPAAAPPEEPAAGYVIPPSAEAAYEQYAKNADRIDSLQKDIDKQAAGLVAETERYDLAKKKLDLALRGLTAAAGKCSADKRDADLRRQQAEDARAALKALNRLVKGDPMEVIPQLDGDVLVLCQEKPDLRLLRAEQVQRVLESVEEGRGRWVQAAQQEIERKRQDRAALDRMQIRLGGIIEKLKTQNERTSNFSDLKWLVLILGILSVLVMLIVRTFPQELQSEWVGSGQVIQFMTVLVLLIAILSLGINGILKENTLGTLLGGIGGYVLAQGVGRAAARSALKQAPRPQPEGPPPPDRS